METVLKGQRDDEVFDVVNDRDEVVGRATRKEVHSKRLWHRAVHALVFGRDGRVFLQKRSMLKDTSPGCWDSSCSGHLDSGEGYDAAVVRELDEEIGLTVKPEHGLKALFKVESRKETGWEFVWVYRLESEGPFELHPAEVEDGAWFTIDEVNAGIEERPRDFTRSFRFIWTVRAGMASR